LEIADHSISPGIELDIDIQSGIVKDLASRKVYQSAKMPKVMIDILEEGGLVKYLALYGNYQL
jgi:3-isopropylmalate dehydratase small subunit